MDDIKTISEFARELGVYHHTLADLVRRKQIETKRVRYNGNARGLDRHDQEVIRRALEPEPEPDCAI